MKKGNLYFEIICQHMAAFMWGDNVVKLFGGKQQLWEALPPETQEQIQDFIAIEFKGPISKHSDQL